jgi:hypothetical protein
MQTRGDRACEKSFTRSAVYGRKRGRAMAFEWTSRDAGATRDESDGKESEERLLRGADLAANADFCNLRLVAFFLNGFLGYGAECLFIRILRRFAMTPNHFFSGHDPHEPVGFCLIPGNFHSVGTHSFLHARCSGFYSLEGLRETLW